MPLASVADQGRNTFPSAAASSTVGELSGDGRDVFALEARSFQLNGRGLTASVAAGNSRGSVGRVAHDLGIAHLALEGIGQSDDHETEMQQDGVESEDCRFP